MCSSDDAALGVLHAAVAVTTCFKGPGEGSNSTSVEGWHCGVWDGVLGVQTVARQQQASPSVLSSWSGS